MSRAPGLSMSRTSGKFPQFPLEGFDVAGSSFLAERGVEAWYGVGIGGSMSSESDPSPASLSIFIQMSLIREDTEKRASINLSFMGSGIPAAWPPLTACRSLLSLSLADRLGWARRSSVVSACPRPPVPGREYRPAFLRSKVAGLSVSPRRIQSPYCGFLQVGV